MALVKCSECGHLVSDRAEACPNCGAPVELSTGMIPTPDVDASTPVDQDIIIGEPRHKSNMGLVIAAVLVLLAIIGSGAWLWHDNQQKRMNLERQIAEQAERARLDSIATAELREKARQDSVAKAQKEAQINSIYNEYVKVLKRHSSGDCFLFDITQDGIPELWVNAFTQSELEEMCEWPDLHVFTISNGQARKMGDFESGSFYYQGSNYVISNWNWKGDILRLIKYSYNGNRIIQKDILTYSWEEEDNIHISEPEITEVNITDYESLKMQIATYFQ